MEYKDKLKELYNDQTAPLAEEHVDMLLELVADTYGLADDGRVKVAEDAKRNFGGNAVEALIETLYYRLYRRQAK
jgi:hypothetical protein